jgi:hypothetical protein
MVFLQVVNLLKNTNNTQREVPELVLWAVLGGVLGNNRAKAEMVL